MSNIQGRILDVYEPRLGTEVNVDHASGVMVLSVYDVVNFDELGGLLEIDGISGQLAYTTIDGDADTIQLTVATTVAISADTQVWPYPAIYDKLALVRLDDQEDSETVRVPQGYVTTLPSGVREEQDQEECWVKFSDGEYTIEDIPGVQVQMDGAYLIPGSVPPPPTIAPTTSPAFAVHPGVGAIYLELTALNNSTTVNVEAHLSTDPNFVPVAGNAATLVKTFNGVWTGIETDAQGVALTDKTKYPSGTTFYVALIAYNTAGTATPTAVLPAQLKRVDTPDVNPAAQWVGTMTFDQLKGGKVTSTGILTGDGGLVAQGAAGEAVTMKPTGFQVVGPTALGNPVYVDFPTTGAPNIISGVLKATTLEVSGDSLGNAMNLRGFSQLGSGAELRIASALQAPLSAPILTPSYSNQAINWNGQPVPGDLSALRGGWWDTTNNLYYFVDPGSNRDTSRVYWMDATRVVQGSQSLTGKLGSTSGSTIPTAYGITRIGNVWYILNSAWITGAPWAVVSRLDLSWNLLGAFFPDASGISQVFTAGIGTDGTSIWIASKASSGNNLNIGKYPADGSSGSSTGGWTFSMSASDWSTYGNVVSIVGTATDLASTRLVVAQAGRNLVFDTATKARVTADEFPVPATQTGLWYRGGLFRSMSTSGSVNDHTTILSTGNVYATSTKYDPAGPYETAESPVRSMAIPKRGGVTATISYDGAPQGRIYMGVGTTDPGRAGRWLQGAITGGVLAYTQSVPFATAGSNPPLATDHPFPGTTPGQIISTDGGSYWKGDNTAKFLQLVVASTTDVTTNAGNMPPLRIGDIAGGHMRLDGNEIQAMAGDTGTAKLILQQGGGGVQIGNLSSIISYIAFNSQSVSTDANGLATFAHGMAAAPDFIAAGTNSQIASFVVTPVSSNGTNITVEIKRSDTNAVVANSSRGIWWLAIKK